MLEIKITKIFKENKINKLYINNKWWSIFEITKSLTLNNSNLNEIINEICGLISGNNEFIKIEKNIYKFIEPKITYLPNNTWTNPENGNVYNLSYCSHCDRHVISCDKCDNSSCNGGGCDQCNDDFTFFVHNHKPLESYLTSSEIHLYRKISKIKRLINQYGDVFPVTKIDFHLLKKEGLL